MPSNNERDELHKAIWSIADDLRGSVDGWDFKQYILGIMFYRYISENITNYINEGERKAGDKNFDYATLSDETAESERLNLVKEKGFFILPSELFCNVCKKAKDDENLNETLEKIFNNIENSAKGAESEDDFSGLFDDIDVNSNKLGATVPKRNEKLVKILNGIAGINLGNYQNHNIDAFGDAYEFLMSMYASNAGKSGGEFYTPQEVSELLTRLAVVGKKSVNKVYDPACGSGSLLLKASKILGKDNVRNGFYGQEINLTTYNLCRINMFLHDIGYDKFNIACEDTLVSPQHWDDEPFEVIVSNPPYSIKWVGDDNSILINDPRYSPAGVLAPKSNADFAFIMHSLSWLANNGIAAIVCYPGILYRRGAEKKIRSYLTRNNFIDCLIQLPENLFFGTPTATCIMVLNKSKKDNNILFIDASQEYVKVTNNNKLTEENVKNIMDVYKDRKDLNEFSKLVSNDEIEQSDYDLSISTYVKQNLKHKTIDINQNKRKTEEILLKQKELNEKLKQIIEEESIINDDSEVIRYNITDIADTFIGMVTTMTKHYVSNGVPLIHNSDIKANKFEFKKRVYLDEEFVEKNKNKKHKIGDIVTVHTGDVGTSAIIGKELEGSIGFATIVTRIKNKNLINTKYLCHFLNSSECKKQILGMIRGDRNNLNLKEFNKLVIPIPKIEEQLKLVELLDEMELINIEMTDALKKEIELRKSQYEYYREKLLTFKESKND